MRNLFTGLIQSLETRKNEAVVSSNTGAQRTVGTVILMMALTGLAGLGLSIVLTRRISRPVRALVTAVHRLSEGRLDQKVDIRGKGELAQLGRAFNQMASSL